ncbi:putative transferase [Helianthus annuus]|nr:putative transferase [Helianthus annuus]
MLQSFVTNPKISTLCLDVLTSKVYPVFVLSLLLDLISNGFKPNQDLKNAIEAVVPESNSEDSDIATTICVVLEIIDRIRVNYWRWRKNNLHSQLAEGDANLNIH